MLSPDMIQMIAQFMGRATLQGAEVEAFTACKQALEEAFQEATRAAPEEAPEDEA